MLGKRSVFIRETDDQLSMEEKRQKLDGDAITVEVARQM